MWATSVACSDDPDPRAFQPPSNEIPVGVSGTELLARTDGIAIAWLGARVFSTGVVFELIVLARESDEDLHEQVFGGRQGRGLLVGFEFADGRRVSTLGRGDAGALLHSQGGGGGDRTVNQSYWLHPVPPAGPLTVVVLAPGLGIGETSTALDATPLARAVAGVRELWPWTPERAPSGFAEPGPELSPDSWFAAGT